MTDIVPVKVTDEQIREMLRPLTPLETSQRTRPVLELLMRFKELPGPVLVKALGLKPYALSNGIGRMLEQAGYVQSRKDKFRKTIVRFYSITPKGRQALKEHLARHRS